jgi:hypothetical protein
MILVFSPLVLYAIVITAFAVTLYLQQRQSEMERRNPFEIMPDDGDHPGVQKGKKQTRVYNYKPEFATMPLPANLRTPLGESIVIGDLKITPERVERKRMEVSVEGSNPAACEADSLVLYLTMENRSSEYAFAPLDNAFDRFWKPGRGLPPFTQLEAGSQRFFGGPAEWVAPGKDKRREWIKGRKTSELLQPGETKNHFFVCTDGNDTVAVRTLFGEIEGEKVREPYHGSFLWRVRVRRGLVTYRGKEYSATAVIGVEFTDKDIQ